MCGYCARRLNPDLIEQMKGELPDTVATTVTANTPGSPALVNAIAAVASGSLQIVDTGVSFRSTDDALSAGVGARDDAFVFAAAVSADEGGSLASWMGRGLPNLAEREIPSMSLQPTDTPEPEFWAFTLASSFEDWLS
ncbi:MULTISPECIES: hypothetical protein [unclassified Ruegeria]|uniref:hypothetical protein n=1 Tax=unclassified Ruegeria TaxID=2625375 RepID=UPI00148996F5|nr:MULTISPECIES: hypothetical protein [unclassified Ruegeria]NOD78381.1 hypothetical protein [Ruegeria sp. HKCCD4332]